MKKLLFLMFLSFTAQADLIIGVQDSRNVVCEMPTEYVSNEPIDADDILTIRWSINGADAGETSGCLLPIHSSAGAGSYSIYAVAVSSKYRTQSLPSNTLAFNILEPKTPNAPAQLNWE